MTISGETVYRDIAKGVGDARAELERVGEELGRVRAEGEALASEELARTAELARIRLAELDSKRIVDGLDAADRRAVHLLEERDAAIARNRDEIAACISRQRGLTEQRDDARGQRDAAQVAHDERVAETMARLAETEEYEFQETRTEETAALATRAAAKAEQAEADRVEKGKPYEADKLFSYLWKRRYRFPEYRASKPIRALDDWVAGLCDYERAHRDYMLLLEIPKRLRAHADARAADAKTELEALHALEAAALADAGVPALADTLAGRERELAELEGRLEDQESLHAELRAQRAAFESGQDSKTREAHTAIAAQVEREDVVTLRRDAARTRTPADDTVVDRIAVLREARRALEDRVTELRREQERALEVVRDLEEMQRRFRRRKYDSFDSRFDSGFDVGELVAGVLRGSVVLGDAWRRIGRHQRFRRRRSTASDVIGSVLSSTLGSSRGGFGGGFGGFGGGGFSSGGGFGGGGGGFRTGGGF